MVFWILILLHFQATFWQHGRKKFYPLQQIWQERKYWKVFDGNKKGETKHFKIRHTFLVHVGVSVHSKQIGLKTTCIVVVLLLLVPSLLILIRALCFLGNGHVTWLMEMYIALVWPVSPVETTLSPILNKNIHTFL